MLNLGAFTTYKPISRKKKRENLQNVSMTMSSGLSVLDVKPRKREHFALSASDIKIQFKEHTATSSSL